MADDLGMMFDGSNWSGPLTVAVADRDIEHYKPDSPFGSKIRGASGGFDDSWTHYYGPTKPMSVARPLSLTTVPPNFHILTANPLLTASAATCIREQGYEIGCFGTQVEAITRQQMESAQRAGLRLHAYVYLLFAGNPTAQVAEAIRRIASFPVETLWLDCEDAFAENLTEAATVAFINAAAKACEGSITSGIYTGKGWWQRQTGDDKTFAARMFPLWHATADGVGDLTPANYGGWTIPNIEQYAFDRDLCGYNADLNVFSRPAAPQPTPGGPVLKSSRIEYSTMTGLYSVINEIAWEAGK